MVRVKKLYIKYEMGAKENTRLNLFETGGRSGSIKDDIEETGKSEG